MTNQTENLELGESILTFTLVCITYLSWLKQVDSNGNGSCTESESDSEDWEQTKDESSGGMRWPGHLINSRLSYTDLFSENDDSQSGDTAESCCEIQQDRNLDHFENSNTYQSSLSSPILEDEVTSTEKHDNRSNPEFQHFGHETSFRSVCTEKTDDGNNSHIASANKNYNSTIMPKKLVMIRHGQSEGNANEKIYAVKPDNALTLTDFGWEQAYMAGKALKENVLSSNEPIHFILSPYVRTLETFHGILSAWCDPNEEFSHIANLQEREEKWYNLLRTKYKITWHEDPRIREQDFGNYQDPEAMKSAKKERHYFGAFYYRFPNGESASDVYDRVSTFLDSLWRSFYSQRCQNYVIITHGISIRVLLSRYYRYTIDQFHMLANPKNCEMVILEHDGCGKLQLQGRCELELEKKNEIQTARHSDFNASWILDEHKNTKKSILSSIFTTSIDDTKETVVGFQFHKRLRTLPPKYIKKRKKRLSAFDL